MSTANPSYSNLTVSVVIPTYNGGTLFQDTVQAVLRQKTSFRTELILIDSSSADGTAEYSKELAAQNPNVLFLSIPKAAFQHGRTRNLAIQQSTGVYVAMITQDAMPVNEHWLETLVGPMLEDPRIAGVFGKHIPYSTADIFEKNLIQKQFSQFGDGLVLFSLSEENKKKFEEDASYRGSLCYYSDNNSALQKKVWEKIPYPEVMFGEDQIWAREIIKQGYIKAYHSEASVYHSHRFGFYGYLNRYKEEGEALYLIHGWKICRYFYQVPWQVLYFVKNDLLFLRTCKLNSSERLFWIWYSVKKNTAKAWGFYLGYKKASQ